MNRQLLRDVGALAAASGVVGVSFGTIAVAAGLPLWLASAMSVLVFAGGSQFLFVAVVSGGGSPVAAVLAGLLLNARHLPFGLAVADVVGGPARLRPAAALAARLVGSHLMVDESVAFALAQSEPVRRRAAYWLSGGALFVAWNAGVLAGGLAGQAMGDPAALGLDAAFPAGLFALLLPSLSGSRDGWRVGLGGAAVALAATPFLPAGVPVLLALAALLLPVVLA